LPTQLQNLTQSQESPRGIGRAICNHLIKSSAYQPLKLWATSPHGINLHLTPTNAHTEIHYPTLDITSEASVKALVDEVKEAQWKEKVDGGEGKVALINNAGFMSLQYNPANVKKTLDVNYRGTLRASIPILKPLVR
jgi:carbonyl reductase 1